VWALPQDVAIALGSLLFTEQGELVGVVARRLLEAPAKIPAELGIDVDTLTPRLATAAGARTGVVVAWVDPDGVASSLLRIGDVIEAIDDVAIASVEQWRVRAARMGIGEKLTLRVTRRGSQRIVQLAASSPSEETGVALGLVGRPVTRVGTEVIRVVPGSAADAAGIVAGDLVTMIGNVTAPTPARIASAFEAMNPGDLLIIAITRDGGHRVVALQR
jgi:S1-C subfamily serine protease